MGRRSLFHHADFLKLWSGQTISELGSEVSLIAIPLTAVIALHASTFQVGLLGAIQFLPFLLVGLPAGVWVDRLPRRRILIIADCGRAVAIGSIPVAALLQRLGLAQLYTVAFASGVLTVFFDVAYQSYLASLIPRSQLVEGNSKLEVTRSTAAIAGPGLGGVLVGWLSAPVAVFVDAFSYVVSVSSLIAIRTRERPAPVVHRSLPRELREGVAYVIGHPVLRLTAACTSTWNLFANMAQAVVIVYAVREVGLSPAQIGLWYAVGGICIPFVAAASGRIVRRIGVGPTLIASVVVGGGASLLIPAAPRPLALPFFIAAGLVGSLGVAYNITQVSLRQAITPARMQGRMNATIRFLVWGTIPVGSFVGGVLGTAVGLRPTLWFAYSAVLLATVPLLFAPVRGLREQPEPVIEPVDDGSEAPSGP